MPQIDVNQLVADVKAAASNVLNTDITTIRGYSERQVQMMAQQASWIASGSLNGSLSGDLRTYFLNNLEDLAKDFANTLYGLLAITIEKLWNAVVGALWDAIGSAIGTPIPKPI